MNLLGEYNIGGDGFVIEELLARCGIKLVATFSGNSNYESLAHSHMADLNAVMCHRSINYVAEMMEKKFGIPWLKVNFIGAEGSAKSLRKIGQYFDDLELTVNIERVIAEEMPGVDAVREEVKARCQGKTAMLFVGGSRAHHYQVLFNEMGIVTVAAGYEFGHRDDYEGRKVLPTVKVDADSRNIEEVEVHRDETRYRVRKSDEEKSKLAAINDLEFMDYKGMMPEMEDDRLVIDDISHHEAQRLLELYKPAIFCAGIKEKYAVQKMGIPCKQLHSYDYGGPYAGFKGAINFYREIYRMVNMKVWSFVKPPWQQPDHPEQPQAAAD
jgi:nitrogenase molybdenum-iron protein alpha chain